MSGRKTASIRNEVDTLMKKVDADHKLSAKDRERLQELAGTGVPWARYQYAMYLYSVENKIEEALEIWNSLGEECYQPAMATLGDYYFYTNAPEHWDISYNNYTGEGSMPLTDARQTAVKDIINHGKYNKRVLIMGMIFCGISVFFMLLTSSFATFHINPVLRIILIILQIALMIQAIRRYRYNSFSTLRQVLPNLLLIWCIYLFLWLM